MDKQYDYLTAEKEIQNFWQKNQIFKFDPLSDKEIFSIDTPPPTVSGKMHIGHGFSYAQQDIVARFAKLSGYNVFYPFGTDDNGLPTEKLVEKLKNVKGTRMDRTEFIDLCQKTLHEILPDFISDWKKLGMSCDFDLYYSTIDDNSRKISQQSFLDLYKKNRAYRIEAPVVWCPSCQTAISQVEMEDAKSESKFCDIVFKLENGEDLIISTTRPELLSSCVAVFVNPEDDRYRNIVGTKANVPLFNQDVPILSDRRAQIEKGTGAVMCCTFGDSTDIEWYKAHKLPLILSIDKSGKMTGAAGKYKGLTVKDAREEIITDLEKAGLKVGEKKIIHDLNVHERCKTEIEIINSKQWFVKYLDLKDKLVETGMSSNWYPDFLRSRLKNWIDGLQWDWCISRQRFFGVPFPVWYCKDCGEVKLAETEDLPVDPTSDNPKNPCKCGSSNFTPEYDVLDTWATSSLTPQIAASLVQNEQLRKKLFPMTLRPQAHDNISFWQFFTLAKSFLHEGRAPWRDIMISGWVLDPKGRKMSKSLGNVIEPEKVILNSGADSIRYWACGASLGQDISFTDEEIRVGKKTVLKLWNAARFCKLQFDENNFKPIDKNSKKIEDEWIEQRRISVARDVREAMVKYELAHTRELLDRFFFDDFTDNYLEIIKERIYGDDPESRESALNTIYKVLLTVIALYSPIASHVTEKIYQIIFSQYNEQKSICQFQYSNLDLDEKIINNQSIENMEKVKLIISAIRRYKSERQLSMKAEINEIVIEAEDDIENYFQMIKNVSNARSIKLGRGDISVSDKIKIKIS